MGKINWWKFGVIAVMLAGMFCFGFYVGKQREPDVIIKEKVKYVELPPVRDSIKVPTPYYVNRPVDSVNVLLALIESGKYAELFPEKVRDSIYVTPADSAAVIRDWATERMYAETLFDADTLGKFTFDASVQYNRLQRFDYTFVPVQKQTETTIKTTRKFLPYVGVGLDTGSSLIGQGGMFFKQDMGFAIQYRRDIKQKENAVGAMFLYMF